MPVLEITDVDFAAEFFALCKTRVFEAIAGLSDAQWRFKPAPDRWSILENVEHMVVVHERILGPLREQLRQAPAPPPDRDFRKIDRVVRVKLPDRTLKAQAPEIIQPPGRLTPAEAIERLRQDYQRLVEFVASTPDLRDHMLPAPPLRYLTGGEYDSMDGYQFALTAAAHDERHVRQIQEIKADPKYPARSD